MSTPKKIDRFTGKYIFLSNFHFPCYVYFEGRYYKSSEHAFQAAKTLDEVERDRIAQSPTPYKAKRLGRKVKLRNDWDQVKLDVMEKILRNKFTDKNLKHALLETGDAELIEGNTWGDTYWGVCRGKGQNHLGKLLMKIRDELRQPTLDL